MMVTYKQIIEDQELEIDSLKKKINQLVDVVRFYSNENNIALSMDEQSFEEQDEAHGYWNRYRERASEILEELSKDDV
jgi:hypothetical protein